MKSMSFALAVQSLPANQQVLVLGDTVGVRNGDGWFAVEDLLWVFEALRLPPVGSLARSLGQLRNLQLARLRAEEKAWAVTPLGRQRVTEILGEVDYDRVELELIGTPGTEYAHARHTVISPSFAPGRWQVGIKRLLEEYPFESNVFCMTRFPNSEREAADDPLVSAINVLRDVIARHGLTMHLASDRQIEDDLLGNVGAYMWACQYGIGILEDRREDSRGLNSNVLIELGSMLVMGRRCAILKDKDAPSPPSDLSGQIYKSVNFSDLGAVADEAHRWLSEDLALGPCDHCPRPHVPIVNGKASSIAHPRLKSSHLRGTDQVRSRS